MKKSRSRSRSPGIPQYPLILAIPSAVIEDRTSVKDEIAAKFRLDRVHLSDEVSLAEKLYRVLYIYSNSVRSKFESLRFVFEKLFEGSCEVVFFFQSLIDPVLLVKQITKVSNVNLEVLPESKLCLERMLRICGSRLDVERLVREAYSFVSDKKPSPERRGLDKDCQGAMLVVSEEVMQKLNVRASGYFKKVKGELGVDIRFVKSGPPCRETEFVLIVSGKARNVRKCLKGVTKQVTEVCEKVYGNEFTLRMLILSSLVKELIGPQGSIIRDISKKAGNAKIKILSNTEAEKSQEYTLVNIDGSIDAKQEAACKVYEIIGKNDRSPRASPEEEDIQIFVSVPDQYVARLIGRSGENVKALMKIAKCKISFQKAPVTEIRINDGEKIRMCYFSGNSSSIAKGVKLLLENIAKLESS